MPEPDPPDFDTFVRTRLHALLRYATVVTGDPALAEDVVQDVLVKACTRWRSVAATDHPEAYVRRMVVNEYVSWRRRWHVRTTTPRDGATLAALGDSRSAAADTADQHALRDDLQQRLRRLPPRQRAVLVLRYYEGLDDEAIAAVLGVRPVTVRSTASRALAALRPDRTAPSRPPAVAVTAPALPEV